MDNKHDNKHHLIDIKDKKSLEENDITYKKIILENDEICNNLIKLSDKIEEETKKIDNSHKEILNEITLSFEKKRQNLVETEKDIKSKLNIKVKQIKEKFTKNLDLFNETLQICEKTKQEVKNYLNQKDINDIKLLYYISEINKNNELAYSLTKTPIKTTNIFFKYDSCVGYKDYYFNGIPIPGYINITKKGKKLFISWDNDLSIEDFGQNKMKYLLQIKEGKNISNYETFEKNFLLDKYEKDTDYEIKIRININNRIGDWSEIKKFREESLKSGENSNNSNKNLLNENKDNKKDLFKDINPFNNFKIKEGKSLFDIPEKNEASENNNKSQEKGQNEKTKNKNEDFFTSDNENKNNKKEKTNLFGNNQNLIDDKFISGGDNKIKFGLFENNKTSNFMNFNSTNPFLNSLKNNKNEKLSLFGMNDNKNQFDGISNNPFVNDNNSEGNENKDNEENEENKENEENEENEDK